MQSGYLQLREFKLEQPVLAVGLMSGTSLDAVDAALIEINSSHDKHISLLSYVEVEIEKSLRSRIQKAMDPRLSPVDLICQLNIELGEMYAKSVEAAIQKSGVSKDQVSFIGSHGQTLYHIPSADNNRNWHTPSTLQIGDPCVIAEKTGILTVGDFRIRDMAAGGVGAPLIPFADAFLFAEPDRDVLCQNIGGIANCTLIQRGGQIIAFDSGPGNMVIDLLVRRFRPELNYDVDGELARKGNVLESLLDVAFSHPYFEETPPKSTGHETFGQGFTDMLVSKSEDASLNDLLATAVELTAKSIADSYKRFIFPQAKPEESIVSGGGSKNPYLMERLCALCPEIRWRRIDEFGIPSEAKEAIGFALLGYATLRGIPANSPSVTGAINAVLLGKIVPGNRRMDLLKTMT